MERSGAPPQRCITWTTPLRRLARRTEALQRPWDLVARACIPLWKGMRIRRPHHLHGGLERRDRLQMRGAAATLVFLRGGGETANPFHGQGAAPARLLLRESSRQRFQPPSDDRHLIQAEAFAQLGIQRAQRGLGAQPGSMAFLGLV